MVQKKGFIVLFLVLIFIFTLTAGCGSKTSADEPTEFMVWQFAQGVVRPRVMNPMHTNFPRYSRQYIEKKESNEFVVTAYLNTLNEENNPITYDFTVVARYVGNDVFEEVSVDVKRRD